MNEIKIRSSLQQHENIIRFFGFQYTKQIVAIVLEVAADNLYDTLKMDKFRDDSQTFIDLFTKLPLDIINGTVEFSNTFYQYFLHIISYRYIFTKTKCFIAIFVQAIYY